MEQYQHEHHHMKHQNHGVKNNIDTTMSFKNNKLSVHLEDDNKKPLKLIKNHEKIMHLIVVSEDLHEFYHLHPEQIDPKTFQTEIKLEKEKAYKAFVDITVEDKNYLIKPICISGGFNHQRMSLALDTVKSKEIEGKRIEFNHSPFLVNQKIELHFDIKNDKPDHYLGALGHVVIIDEQVEKFIHVHPKSDNETTFETYFDTPGKYKLWAEFKFGQKIVNFPYAFSVELKHVIQ